jgi:hypothetical protein
MLAGDVDLDGTVTPLDIERFCDAWCHADCSTADLDRNGRLDVADVVIVFINQASRRPAAAD